MNTILQEISNIGIVPVIAIEDAAKAVPLARALAAGGLPAAEVTFRTAAAEDAIRSIAAEVPEILVGAGTVTTRDQLDRALAAGAKFIVSPGFNPDTVKYGISRGALMLPGTATGGEMEQAMALGLEAVKFFPAEQNGGAAMLRALAGPYRTLKWMPTGGVNAKNMMDYLSLGQVAACGGTWMVRRELIDGERWEEITAICRDAVRIMLGLEIRHIGINCANPAQAERTARQICALFGFDCKPGESSCFAGTAVECMNAPGRGANGHIAIGTNSVARAMYHLGRRGAAFDETSAKRDAKGAIRSIYLKEEIGGFAFHLVQK